MSSSGGQYVTLYWGLSISWYSIHIQLHCVTLFCKSFKLIFNCKSWVQLQSLHRLIVTSWKAVWRSSTKKKFSLIFFVIFFHLASRIRATMREEASISPSKVRPTWLKKVNLTPRKRGSCCCSTTEKNTLMQ